MAKFTAKCPPIEGLVVVRPTALGESRDYLVELTAQDDLEQAGVSDRFVHCSSEVYARGVIRGLHFQRKGSYGRLLAVTKGRALAVAVDLRPESKTFGGAFSVELNSDNEAMLYIPPYFAHGFMTLERDTEVVLNCAAEPNVELESGIIYDDEILAIDWQFERYEIDGHRLNISPRDKKNPSFRSYNQNALWIDRPKKSKYALSRR